MKEKTRNTIVENIGLAWVYSPPKARGYLNEALRGFAQDRKEQEEAANRLLAHVFSDEKPARGKPVVGGTRKLDPKTKQVLKVLVTRAYPVTLDTILRNTDVRSKMAVHKHIEAIRNAGYNVQTITTGRKKRKYKLGA
jgi:biotin operon repressor